MGATVQKVISYFYRCLLWSLLYFGQYFFADGHPGTHPSFSGFDIEVRIGALSLCLLVCPFLVNIRRRRICARGIADVYEAEVYA